ncbi:MAG: hypothetical protein AAFX39_09840 [Pseudomonadota bacterium]
MIAIRKGHFERTRRLAIGLALILTAALAAFAAGIQGALSSLIDHRLLPASFEWLFTLGAALFLAVSLSWQERIDRTHGAAEDD